MNYKLIYATIALLHCSVSVADEKGFQLYYKKATEKFSKQQFEAQKNLFTQHRLLENKLKSDALAMTEKELADKVDPQKLKKFLTTQRAYLNKVKTNILASNYNHLEGTKELAQAAQELKKDPSYKLLFKQRTENEQQEMILLLLSPEKIRILIDGVEAELQVKQDALQETLQHTPHLLDRMVIRTTLIATIVGKGVTESLRKAVKVAQQKIDKYNPLNTLKEKLNNFDLASLIRNTI